MTTNDRSTPKKAENAQVQAVRKEFTLSGSEQNLDPAALGSRTPLELLADWLEAEAACDGTHEASVLAVLARSRVITLDPAALRAQAEAGAGEITAEVWVESGYAELMSVTGRVSALVWQDLQTDLTENSPELPEGLYAVPVGRDNTDPTGEASATHTYYLDWDRAALTQARTVGGAP